MAEVTPSRSAPVPGRAGRPRRSSLDMLEEAAAELFLEQGYAGTSIDDIATRAGVSRNTVFNYVRGKGDLLWVGPDRLIDSFADALKADALRADTSKADALNGAAASVPTRTTAGAVTALREAYLATAIRTGSEAVPWAVTQADLMGTREGLASSGLTRLARHAEGIRSFLEEGGMDRPAARVAAFAFAGAATAAVAEWIDAGVGRDPLERYLLPAIDPVARGFGVEPLGAALLTAGPPDPLSRG